jgi:hypothetical protein
MFNIKGNILKTMETSLKNSHSSKSMSNQQLNKMDHLLIIYNIQSDITTIYSKICMNIA